MSPFLFAFGICRPEQYTPHWPVPDTPAHDRVSYRLLLTSTPPSPTEILRFERLMRQIQFTDGVFRTTSPDRFRELDRFVQPLLERLFPPAAPLDIYDWAASDCSTSAAWFRALEPAFPQVRLTASDLSLYLVEALLPAGDSYIFEAGGTALQYIRPPFVLRVSSPEPRRLLGNRFLRARARARLARLQAGGALRVAGLEFGDASELDQPPYRFRKIPLIHPIAEALCRSHPAFRIVRHSVFDPLPQPGHVIRSMNIFNLGYFDAGRLRQGAGAVWQSLLPGGVWIVGRTVREIPPLHNASILRRTATGFTLLDRHVGKSEMEDLALALRPET